MNVLIDDVEKFRASLDEKHQEFEVVDPPNVSYQIARELCFLLGLRLYCCDRLVYIGVTDFRCIFVRVPEDDTQHPLWVAGHETWHMLQHYFGEVVYPFQEGSIALLVPDAIRQRRFIQDDGALRAMRALTGQAVEEPESPHKTVVDEVFADVYANAWCDRDFWVEVRDKAGLHSSYAIESMLAFLLDEKIASYRQWHASPSNVRDRLAAITVAWLTAGKACADMGEHRSAAPAASVPQTTTAKHRRRNATSEDS
jgi:hypothetical protein